MNTMHAVTAMELEAARRREVLMEARAASTIASAPRIRLDRSTRREPAWLAATLSVVAAGARVARG